MFKIRNGSYVVAHELTSDHKPGRCDEQQVGLGHSYTVCNHCCYFLCLRQFPCLGCKAMRDAQSRCEHPHTRGCHSLLKASRADTMLDYSYARLTLCGIRDPINIALYASRGSRTWADSWWSWVCHVSTDILLYRERSGMSTSRPLSSQILRSRWPPTD